MAIKIKICGVTRLEDAIAAARTGADYAGLVFHRGSPRCLSIEKAQSIAANLRNRVQIVALFADADNCTIAETVDSVKPDLLQLHGIESPGRVAEIRRRFDCPVIKAIGIADGDDFSAVPGYEAVADMLLFDGKPAAGAPGGRGVPFDWQLLRGRMIRKPWLLAGGLNVQNAARAIAIAGAPGVDVSSGVETSPGVKDEQAIRAFVEAARAVEFARGASA